MAISAFEEVKIFVLSFKKQLVRNGPTTYGWTDVELPEISSWGPYMESIQVHTLTEITAPPITSGKSVSTSTSLTGAHVR